MDFQIATNPYLPTTWDEWKDLLTFGHGPKWLIEVAGNFALTGAGTQFLSKGSLFTNTFKLQPGISKATAFIVPFTMSAKEPGVIHLVADLAFYKYELVFASIDDAIRRYKEWIAHLTAEELRQELGDEQYALATDHGRITTLTAVVSIPPAWFTDP